MKKNVAIVALLLVSLQLSASGVPRAATLKHSARFDTAALRAIDEAIDDAVAAKQLPGGVYHLERDGAIYERVYGRRALVPAPEPMTADTIFDAASLTKVVATAPSIWLLIEQGKVGLDEPVLTYLPEYRGTLRDEITIRHLLTHTLSLIHI